MDSIYYAYRQKILGRPPPSSSSESFGATSSSSSKDTERPSYQQTFMDMAFLISKRSIDPSTKHGCVIVDDQNRVVSMGYNGPVQGIPHDLIDWSRPKKYAWMLHAEENAVIFAKQSLEGCTAYVTGPSCPSCFVCLWSVLIISVFWMYWNAKPGWWLNMMGRQSGFRALAFL